MNNNAPHGLEQQILNRVLLVMGLAGALIFVLSSIRIITEGFQPKFGIMWLVAAGILSLKLFHNKLHVQVTGYLLFALFTVMGLVALVNDGLASIGSIFLFLGLSTSAVVVDAKKLLALTGLQFLSFSVITVLTATNVLTPIPDEGMEYLTSGKTWIFHGIVIAVGAAISFYGSSILGEWYRSNLDETKNVFYNAISILSLARDTETGEHIERVSKYSEILYDAMQSTPMFQLTFSKSSLSKAVQLHDVGKIAIPDAILKKPGKLTNLEFEEMKRHTVIGAEIIATIQSHYRVTDPVLNLGHSIALGHHENWDGSGYPRGISSESIPIEAQIMAVADVYDALRSERPYKTSFSHDKTIQIMKDMCGTKFDPRLFSVFLTVSEKFKKAYAEP